MLVALVLSKNMQIDWREGEKWFWDTLVAADIASNPGSWQWVAGCGMDAAPYFRVFNPVLQGDKFDMHGVYLRKWVPEIALLLRFSILRLLYLFVTFLPQFVQPTAEVPLGLQFRSRRCGETCGPLMIGWGAALVSRHCKRKQIADIGESPVRGRKFPDWQSGRFFRKLYSQSGFRCKNSFGT